MVVRDKMLPLLLINNTLQDMEKLTEKPEVANYGKDCRKIGYEEGYLRSTLDRRKLKFTRERTIRKLSDDFIDWLDDLISLKAKKR